MWLPPHSRPGEIMHSHLYKALRLLPTSTLLSGSDMWHSNPKHTVAAVTVSSDEEEGHMCQTVLLWDNGDNISLGPWVTVDPVTLQSHLGHRAWARNKKCTLCSNSIPSPFTSPFHMHTAYTFLPEKKKNICYFASTILPSFHYWFWLQKEIELMSAGIRQGWVPGSSSGF